MRCVDTHCGFLTVGMQPRTLLATFTMPLLHTQLLLLLYVVDDHDDESCVWIVYVLMYWTSSGIALSCAWRERTGNGLVKERVSGTFL
jgi:hypothetical protein